MVCGAAWLQYLRTDSTNTSRPSLSTSLTHRTSSSRTATSSSVWFRAPTRSSWTSSALAASPLQPCSRTPNRSSSAAAALKYLASRPVVRPVLLSVCTFDFWRLFVWLTCVQVALSARSTKLCHPHVYVRTSRERTCIPSTAGVGDWRFVTRSVPPPACIKC